MNTVQADFFTPCPFACLCWISHGVYPETVEGFEMTGAILFVISSESVKSFACYNRKLHHSARSGDLTAKRELR
jgi:hypothetical protein